MQRVQQRISRSTIFTFVTALQRRVDTRTHEDKDAISILLPAMGHFLVFFLCHLNVHMEEGP